MKFKVEHYYSGPYMIPYIATCKTYEAAVACIYKHITKGTPYKLSDYIIDKKSKFEFHVTHKSDSSSKTVYTITMHK